MNQFLDPTNLAFEVDEEYIPAEPLHTPSLQAVEALPNRWSPQLIFDLALGLSEPDQILERYGLTQEQLDKLYTIPSFRKDVAMLARELRENRTLFKHKAANQAELYLDDLHLMMKDDGVAASTKLQIFQTLAKYGELEPKEEKQNPLNGGGMQVSRMVVEWVGGTKDLSPVAQPKTIELSH